MDTYTFFKDFSAPLATALAAFSAAFVTGVFAYRQAKSADLQARVALDRLKHDTFEHRHDVLDACRDLMGMYDERLPFNIVDVKILGEYTLRIAKGKFYFGRAANNSLEEYVKSAADTARVQFDAHYAKKGSVQRTNLEENAVARIRLLRQQLMVVNYSLEYDLSLNFLKEGSDREHGRRQSAAMLVPVPTAAYEPKYPKPKAEA